MYKIALTGGIGCGKSVVSNLFKDLDTPVIDADEIAHALVSPGQEALNLIQIHFGSAFINPNGSLNRKQLRDCIFQDSNKKRHLENIMHPLIYTEINQQLSQLTSAYVIIAIPLILETGQQSRVDHILVVDCPMEMQINRVKLRDDMSKLQVMAIINSQVQRSERLSQADSIIENTQDIIFLRQQVNTLHNQFLKQAQ